MFHLKLIDYSVDPVFSQPIAENQQFRSTWKVEIDGSKGQFVSEYFRTSCPSYYKRDHFDKMF